MADLFDRCRTAMRLTALAIVVQCLAVPSIVSAQALPEQADFEILPGFYLAHEDGDGDRFIREYVREGETVSAWTEMQTHQVFPDLAESDPIRYVMVVAEVLPAECRGREPYITRGEIGGAPNALLAGSCQRPEGGLEHFLLVALSGSDALHVIQHAWRRDFSEEELVARHDALTTTPLCGGTWGSCSD